MTTATMTVSTPQSVETRRIRLLTRDEALRAVAQTCARSLSLMVEEDETGAEAWLVDGDAVEAAWRPVDGRPLVWIGARPEWLRPQDVHLARPLRLQVLQAALDKVLAQVPMATKGSWRLQSRERMLTDPEKGLSVRLTAREMQMLSMLSQAHAGEARREVLLAQVWGFAPETETHALETQVYRLRAKLKRAGFAAPKIVSVPGGYRLEN